LKPVKFPSLIRLQLEPALRNALIEAADRDCTTMSEFVRRALRDAVKTHAARDAEATRCFNLPEHASVCQAEAA